MARAERVDQRVNPAMEEKENIEGAWRICARENVPSL